MSTIVLRTGEVEKNRLELEAALPALRRAILVDMEAFMAVEDGVGIGMPTYSPWQQYPSSANAAKKKRWRTNLVTGA